MKRGFMPIAGMEDRFGVEKNKIPLPKRSTSGSASPISEKKNNTFSSVKKWHREFS